MQQTIINTTESKKEDKITAKRYNVKEEENYKQFNNTLHSTLRNFNAEQGKPTLKT